MKLANKHVFAISVASLFLKTSQHDSKLILFLAKVLCHLHVVLLLVLTDPSQNLRVHILDCLVKLRIAIMDQLL